MNMDMFYLASDTHGLLYLELFQKKLDWNI